MMIIGNLFNRFHDLCEKDSVYRSWFYFLLNAKCINVDVAF